MRPRCVRYGSPVTHAEPYLQMAERLASLRGVVAVVLGGSRALGNARADSDFDLGVYYRGEIDLTALAEFGAVYPPGTWGRIMNGGAWLTIDAVRIDVLLRDLDVVDALCARAEQGSFDIDALLGYAAGVPTYSVLAERAVAVPLFGRTVTGADYPTRLAGTAPERWRFNAGFSFDYAAKHAARADVIGTAAMVGRAALEEAHARLSENAKWVLNEKGMLERAGLQGLQAKFQGLPRTAAELVDWVAEFRRSTSR
jgi:hypothetical protein